MRRILRNLAISAVIAVTTQHAYSSNRNSIILQSTTSTQNSGLFEFILPKFRQKTGITVHVVAVGTGQALKNGRNGDGDVLLVHAKSAEEKFVAEGYGIKRFNVMYNDFVIVGPMADPADVSETLSVSAAFASIFAGKFTFISRGDDSGTHKKELALWRKINLDTEKYNGSWYRETGSGMGATLNIASGMGAYTMTDRATWIAFQNKGDLNILSEGDSALFNQYGIIAVNPKRYAHIKKKESQAFIQWLTGMDGQRAINAYRLDGRQLFFANAN